MSSTPLLQVQNLSVHIQQGARTVRPVEGLSLSLHAGETFALVGESGCGKSMTAQALLRLLPPGGRIVQGQIDFAGKSLLALPESQMRRIRGGQMSMIFQEPGTSLNPVLTVAQQIGEVLALHQNLHGQAARQETVALLAAVGIPDPAQRLDQYPFEFSGGMKQRVMIAMALAGQPQLLIADEPTTALDVTIQAQVLTLLQNLQRKKNMSMLLITHDLGVVSQIAQHVGVMYAGQMLETGPRESFFSAPCHPYTRKLFAALPGAAQRGQGLETLEGSVPPLDQVLVGCRFVARCEQALPHCHHIAPDWHTVGMQQVRCHLYAPQSEAGFGPTSKQPKTSSVSSSPAQAKPLLSVENLSVHFQTRHSSPFARKGAVRAVDGLDLQLYAGRTLALVGESGCGKTTVGKALMQLIRPSGGQIFLQGENIAGLNKTALKAARQKMQMVFQDPFASLNPRMRIGDIIEEGMKSLGVGENITQRQASIATLLARMGLDQAVRTRYPHEFSGGQRQRIALARVLAVAPSIVICDEPTSALDVSVQAQLLNLLNELQHELNLSYLFITHNLAVVEYLAHDVAVMYLGRIVETGPIDHIFKHTAHPYTQALLAAAPKIQTSPAPASTSTAFIEGDLPSPLAPPVGCHFHPRCPKASEVCKKNYPDWQTLSGTHKVRCHWPQKISMSYL